MTPQKPEDSILPGKPAEPLPGIGPVFSEGNNYSPKAPIDFDGHVIGAEVKPNGSVVGGHSTALGNVRVILGTESAPNAYGVYMAEIEVADPSNPGKYLAKTNNNGVSTMFPKSWSSDKIKMEVDVAFQNKVVNGNKWTGVTPSGVKVEGYLRPKTTVYPKM